MEYYINGKSNVLDDLTAEQKAFVASQEEKSRLSHWQTISYGEAVDREIRKKYAQHQVEAILNNYISDPSNVEYAEEFTSLQEYRNQCKEYVKAFMKSIPSLNIV